MSFSERPQAVERDLTARGARVRFVEAGEGAPLVLVHDFLASHAQWDDVVEPLARQFRVIAIDLPGFGDSEKPDPARYDYGFGAFAEAIVDLVAALQLPRVSICGQGMGAQIAIALAASHPHVVDRLILTSPAVYAEKKKPAVRVAQVPIVGSLAFTQLYGRRFFDSQFGYSEITPKIRARLDALFDRFNEPQARRAALATLVATGDLRPIVARLSRVQAPSLILSTRSARTSQRLSKELNGSTLEVLSCAFSPAEEQPEIFERHVARFLVAPPPKARPRKTVSKLGIA